MKTKVVVVSLILSVGSIALSSTAAMVGLFSYGPKILEQQDQIALLTEKLDSVSQNAANNLTRINELDSGLTALIEVSGVDLAMLAQVMAGEIQSAGQPQLPQENGADVTTQPQPAPLPDDEIDNGSYAEFMDEISNDPEVTASDAEEPLPLAIPEPVKPQRVDAILAQRISANWVKPGGDTGGLKAVVTMKLSRDGKLESVVVSKPSGNDAFDDSAIIAIQSIGQIEEVTHLSDDDYLKFYAERSLLFAPSSDS